ncbi:MAG: LLM class flavin-dependent oxidoreductase, partial [Actinomycetes bacterium]
VTVQELADLTDLAEELDFDSVWTLDRVCVPEVSDRGELQYSFGMMKEFPTQLPVQSRGKWFQGWPLLPWLAARTEKVRIGMSITNTPFRGPAVFATECATIDHLSNGRLNVGIGSGWIGIQDTPRELTEWRTAIAGELEKLGKSIADLDMCSMIWFTITDGDVDQTDNGKVSNILVGSERQITDMLKRYQEAGLTMPLLWPPFADVPVSKTLDDLKRLKNDIMPKVEAA